MRLWTLHPRYLDPRGLVALWREGLLALAVVRGQTRGYTRHPQLCRFIRTGQAAELLREYLHVVREEAQRRGYRFDGRKVGGRASGSGRWRIPVTEGQLRYEWRHLCTKLESRNPAWLSQLRHIRTPDPHPLFRVVPGRVESWEKVPRH